MKARINWINKTVSSGTLDLSDLVIKMSDVLFSIDRIAYAEMCEDYLIENGDIKTYVKKNEEDIDTLGFLFDSLYDALDERAPQGCYFGTHIGDGAEYGFWQYASEH